MEEERRMKDADNEAIGTEDCRAIDNAWRREYQVESGSVDGRVVRGGITIFSEVFPSWLLVLNNRVNKLQEVVVFVKEEAKWFRAVLDIDFKYKIINSWDEMDRRWNERNTSEHRTIFIQGSSRFACQLLAKISASLGENERLVVVCSGRLASSSRAAGLQWIRKSHTEFGGVTSTLYHLGASSKLNLGYWRDIRPSKCSRSLIDITRVDKGGIECLDPSTVESSSLIDPHFPIAAKELTSRISLPSVFNKNTGWVQRKLSKAEIALAMDFPARLLPTVEVHSLLLPSLMKTIMTLPPVKVIQGVLNMILHLDDPEVNVPTVSQEPLEPTLSLSTNSPEVETVVMSEANLKSVKHDDAETPSELWDIQVFKHVKTSVRRNLMQLGHSVEDHCIPGPIEKVFNFLRRIMLRQFKMNVLRSAIGFLKETYGANWQQLAQSSGGKSKVCIDVEAIRLSLSYTSKSEFWDWPGGSFPLFWRWPVEVQRDMRDGTPLFIKGTLPRFRKPQCKPKDPEIAEKVASKLAIPLAKGYMTKGHITSLTSYFHVPKGSEDIRLVYDLTACGLNEALWAPSFWMPTSKHVLDCATSGSWFGDVDAGEMFLNYILDVSLRPYAGIDVSWLDEDANPEGLLWARWNRMPMGMLPSPWVTIRLFAWAMEVIRGNREDKNNPFHWSKVTLNCPGSSDYDPSMPRLYKWSDVWNSIAGDAKTFVDDLRSIGCSEHHCRLITHQVESLMGYLGLQDATRKRRPVTPTPGEWTGAIVRAIPGVGVFVTVSTKKWNKVQCILQELKDAFSSSVDRPSLNLKKLEQKVGFLVHVAMTYPMMFPFLKGFYLTMNSWRQGRDLEDWKLPPSAYRVFMAESRKNKTPFGMNDAVRDENNAPEEVTASPLLFDHIQSLLILFDGHDPTLRLVRGTAIVEVVYVFGDASGAGFGSSWADAKAMKTSWRFGVWGVETKDGSSNYKELRNLTETLEEMGCKGDLQGREIFLFTDNMVSEAVVSKGSSQSPFLYELVIRIIKLQMKYRCIVHFIHVAGTRMIEQGSDGLSRGDMHEGIMSGKSMLDFVPLHLSVCSIHRELKDWLEGWMTQLGNPVEFLTPEGWFERGHDVNGSTTNSDNVWIPTFTKGSFVWAPPPAVSGIVMDELRQARHKRQRSFHVFVCSRLMYPEWRRGLYKSADMIVEVKAGKCSFWPSQAHETLIIAIYFPYLHRCPWELRKTPLLVGMARKVSKVLSTDESAGSNLLSEFCAFTRRLDHMPFLQLSRVLSGRSKLSFSR